MITIYHNPRCAKSRAGLAYLESKNVEFEIRQYLKELLTVEELSELISKSDMPPIDFVRKQESYFKENLKGKDLSNEELIAEMIKEPKLIQRPIIYDGNKAILANPPENLDKII